MRWPCSTFLLLACACTAPPALVTDAAFAGPFTTRSSALVDGNGGQILLRGANLSQSAKFPPHVPRQMDGDGRSLLSAHGPMALRYLVTWAAIEPEDGAVDEGFLRDLEERTRALAEDEHLIVLDLHQDMFGEGFPGGDGAPPFACDAAAYEGFEPVTPWFLNYSAPAMQGCFDALFSDEQRLRQMARALRSAVDAAQRGAGAHLVGVDLINEPHPGSLSPAAFDARLLRYYEIAAEELRDTGVALFFEPNVLHNLGEPTALARAPSAAAVFAPHLYPYDAEIGLYQDAAGLGGLLQTFAEEARAFGTPLVIGEYAPLLSDPRAGAFVDDLMFLLDDAQAGAFYWDWHENDDRGLLHADAEALRKQALRPHARRVAGKLLTHTFDAASGQLVVEFEENGALGASEIVVPSHWGEAQVEISDGEAQTLGSLVRVWHEPAVAVHRVVVRVKGGAFPPID